MAIGIVLDTATSTVVYGVYVEALTQGIVVRNSSEGSTITDFIVYFPEETAVEINNSDFCTIRGTVNFAENHGMRITNSDHTRVEVTIYNSGFGTTNTYDNLLIDGASNRNMIQNSKFRALLSGGTTRYGVNVSGSGECNIVVGNDLGDPDDYATDALGNTASNTQLFYPADATYGDNWTDCGSGS